MIKISRSKLVPKVLLGLTVLVTILGFTTTARAGIPPFFWDYVFQYNQISSFGLDVEAPHDEPCLWGVMSSCSEDEIGYFPQPPYEQKLFIDGDEINLLRFVWTDKEGMFGTPGLKWFVFYQTFEAGYFSVGEHEILHEMWVQKPYLGDEIYGWRIYVTLTYTLKIT